MKKHFFSFNEAEALINQSDPLPRHVPNIEVMQAGFHDLFYKDMSYFETSTVILVAGTNGKGTVAKTLQTLLTERGHCVGLYTSPHLISICERIQINGKPISQDLFAKCFQKLFDIYQKRHLSHFEILTLMALELFFKGRLIPPVEYAIFEVGMGGKWDATNVIPHKMSILTQIDYDHQHLLGKTLLEIAKQKFGIVHQHNQVIVPYGFYKNEVLSLLQKEVQEQTQSKWYESEAWTYHSETIDQSPKGFIHIGGKEQEMNLLGKRAGENTAIALKAYQVLGFDPLTNLKALKKVQWEGRMHRESLAFCTCPVYFSGDHNRQGIRSLVDILQGFQYENMYFLVSVGQTKEPKDILQELLAVKNAFVYLTTAQFKGREKQEYGKWLLQVAGYIEDPIKAFFQTCKKCQKHDLMVVTGSLYLVGELMTYLRQ